MKRLAESVRNLATTAEDNIANAASSHMRLEADLKTLISAYEEVKGFPFFHDSGLKPVLTPIPVFFRPHAREVRL